MELHLHLSVAFRALDRKWGTPVDLDTSGETATCLPAVIDRSTTTFSSEDFLKARRPRPKPYSRTQEPRKRKINIKRNDSFADISSTRLPSLDDVECNSDFIDEDTFIKNLIEERLQDEFDKKSASSMTSLLSIFNGKKLTVFRQFKKSAVAYIEKCKKDRN
ncbi:hypothetical protein O3G_MSEX006275 [Manduca sexta]|uniref:Uncharacterized protein n=1 Tax=Manduca sexta TaxID=7130 RepID=A0A921Z305_MANSE|nr:hypothetical protein O3G_MSEX006275 [Manduca sexta]